MGGMTKEQFSTLVKAMKAVYTHPSFIPDKHAFDVWYEMLKDIDYKTASYAIKKYMLSEEKEPTIAGIRKQAASLQENPNEELNEMAAWALVQKAIGRSAYYSKEEFSKLPQLVQKAVSSPGQLREWAIADNMSGSALSVIQSNFMRTYRTELERKHEKQKLSPDILKLIQSIGTNQKAIETSE